MCACMCVSFSVCWTCLFPSAGDLELVSSYYCKVTNTVLRRTPLWTYLNFADATALCSINHGRIVTFAAYEAGCVSAALEENMIAWLNKDGDPGMALVADNSRITSTRYKTKVLYAMCETGKRFLLVV